MSDCLNTELRERLPELLHGRLPAAEQSALTSHLAACADCASEFEMLRGVRAAVQALPVPRIDTARVVAALPKPQRAVARPYGSRTLWRAAAVLAVVAIGGTSIYTARGVIGEGVGDTATPPTTPLDTPIVATIDAPTGVARTPSSEGLTAGGVTSLADEDLEALIGALDAIEAAPAVDPEATAVVRIVPQTPRGS